MLSMSRILAPVDFSERCLGMMPYVKSLAKRYDSEVILLHVVNPFYTVPSTALSGPVMIPIPNSAVTDAQARLDKFAVAELSKLRVRRLLYEGDPASQIVQFAKTKKVQLIAMSTHGYGTLRRFLIGSETAKILHDVSCPVLTGVHTEKRAASKTVKVSRILCAVNLGSESTRVVAWASRLASDLNAQLRLLHVKAPFNAGIEGILPSGLIGRIEKSERERFEKLIRKSGVTIDAADLREGDVPETVCDLAKSTRADLLVVGRGAPDESGGRLTAHAYAIIRQSPCPVISVRY